MNYQPPLHESLTTRELGEALASTTATYKFYWLLALLNRFVRKGESRISVKDLTIGMVVHAWYTVNYFKHSFGRWDSLYEVVRELQSILKIPMDSSKIDDFDLIRYESSKADVSASLKKLAVHVPYRFLSPWIRYISDKDVIARSLQFENQCLYSLNKEKEEFYVVVNCNILRERVVLENDLAFAMFDGFAVSPGHSLIIPKRHVASYFDSTQDEILAIHDLIPKVKNLIEQNNKPDGYNIGINVGEVADQSVFHVHVHGIPRYKGVVANPRGGVRSVIPSKQNFKKSCCQR